MKLRIEHEATLPAAEAFLAELNAWLGTLEDESKATTYLTLRRMRRDLEGQLRHHRKTVELDELNAEIAQKEPITERRRAS